MEKFIKEESKMLVSDLEALIHPLKNKREWERRYWQSSYLTEKVPIVIDDDPTGIQTVHGIKVYMEWNVDVIDEIFKEGKLAYLQTNSRSLSEKEAVAINREIMERLFIASEKHHKNFSVISRSDSSLRGHYPAETNALKEAYETLSAKKIDAELFIPAFFEAGRITYGDVHYLIDENRLIPMEATEFANDAVFGYQHSNLKKYIEEKTNGNTIAQDVISIDYSLIRNANEKEILEILLKSSGFQKIVVNALDYEDLQVVVTLIRQAEQLGKRFIFRSAASFVKVYAGIQSQPLLQANNLLSLPIKSMLIVAGSHTEKTTKQIEKAQEFPLTELHQINLADVDITDEINRAANFIDYTISEGKIPIIFTQRKKILSKTDNEEENLLISIQVSSMLVKILQKIKVKPDVLLAKGGITSSDLAVKSLGIKNAVVLGQILPGIPVIQAGPESRWPGLPYIIFPGNVGSEEALLQILQKLFQSVPFRR